MNAPSATPSSAQRFGEALRGLRESAGVTLDSISAETKISRRILEALEQGHFQFLPEQVFTRNFVRQYTRAVGGDEVELLELFDTAWERFMVTSGSHPRVEEVSQPPRDPVRWRFWLPLALGVVLPWYQVRHRLQDALKGNQVLLYSGRRPAAAPATGIPQMHANEQHGLFAAAIKASTQEQSARSTTRLRATGSTRKKS